MVFWCTFVPSFPILAKSWKIKKNQFYWVCFLPHSAPFHCISRAKHLHFLGEKLRVQVQISSPLFYASLRSSKRNLVYPCLILRGTLEEVCFPSNYKRKLGGELQLNSHLRQRMWYSVLTPKEPSKELPSICQNLDRKTKRKMKDRKTG